MSKTLETNGQTRKTLASQLDRLDSILDGLSEGLTDAVASAVREAVGLAVQEAVQAVLTELLTNPALREQQQKAAPPAPPPPAERTPEGGGGRLAADRVRAALLVAVAYLARTTLPAAARRLCGAARSLADRAWGALRRELPRLALCGA